MIDLHNYRTNVSSQAGQDGVLQHLFEAMGVSEGCCVEFGAWDGEHLSNTRQLLLKGWAGLLIESDPEKFNTLHGRYEDREDVFTFNDDVTPENIEDLFDGAGLPEDFDFLSIDIDGPDYHVWEALNKYRPKAVLIETAVAVPWFVSYKHEPGGPVRGSSPLALFLLARSKGYRPVCFISHDWLFVREDLLEDIPIVRKSYFDLLSEGSIGMGMYSTMPILGRGQVDFLENGREQTMSLLGLGNLEFRLSADDIRLLTEL